MSTIYVPPEQPPIVTDESVSAIEAGIGLTGVTVMYKMGVDVIRAKYPNLREHLNSIIFEDQSGDMILDWRTRAAVRIGAAFTALAYDFEGYEVTDDSDDAGNMIALTIDAEGVPEAYITRFVTDLKLSDIISVVSATPEMTNGIEEGEFDHLMEFGAGATRLFAQTALITSNN